MKGSTGGVGVTRLNGGKKTTSRDGRCYIMPRFCQYAPPRFITINYYNTNIIIMECGGYCYCSHEGKLRGSSWVHGQGLGQSVMLIDLAICDPVRDMVLARITT